MVFSESTVKLPGNTVLEHHYFEKLTKKKTHSITNLKIYFNHVNFNVIVSRVHEFTQIRSF